MASDDDLIGPINIGNSNEFKISELAETVVRMTGSKAGIEYKDLPLDDPQKRKPDISIAKKLLDWNPKINLEEGLLRTIQYFEN